ncbi:Fructokinase-2 [Platanthera guangdongensis]|uniref:Fructokinase-2 n=1 Tax=Platanthera guangdongensis TaxID=2320717 RepID=A0ABR2LRT3_9ASPA
MFYRNPSADMLLTPTELDLDLIRRALEVAKEAGVLLSYDPNLRLPLWPSAEEAKEQILSIWNYADVIKVSDVELEFLTGIDSVEDEVALTLWRPTLKLLLVTLGEKGCKYYTKDFHGAVDAYTVKQIDTTGAGDAFVGALLCKLVDDMSVLQVSCSHSMAPLFNWLEAWGALSAPYPLRLVSDCLLEKRGAVFLSVDGALALERVRRLLAESSPGACWRRACRALDEREYEGLLLKENTQGTCWSLGGERTERLLVGRVQDACWRRAHGALAGIERAGAFAGGKRAECLLEGSVRSAGGKRLV